MTVTPGYYRLSTLLMMLADVDRDAALALITPTLTVNGIAVADAFTDPRIDCTSGSVSLSIEGGYTASLSSYYRGGLLEVAVPVSVDPYIDGFS